MSIKLSVIAFSKDRPMQLHAYLESLMKFSEINEQEISVIYADSERISYEKVIASFPAVKWVREKNFYDDLMRVLEECDDCFMFGCDDVVFTKKFSIKDAKNFLLTNDNIFGVSFRLGKNIKLPKNYYIRENFLVWDWRNAETVHYNYAWELDCTLYRKDDAKSIITLGKSRAFAPNPLEGIVTMNPEGYIKRYELACYNSDSKAIVITVNRVQDHAQNSFDGRNAITEPEYLGKLYNVENVRLDIEAISKLKNSQIHVGLEYMILTNGFRGKPRSIFGKIISRRFMYYIAREIYRAMRKVYRTLRAPIRMLLSRLSWYFEDKSKFPVILSTQESLEYLKKNLMSFCRFGDGELQCLEGGGGISFQRAERRLTQNLQEIISVPRDDVLIGMPFLYFSENENLTSRLTDYWNCDVLKYRRQILKFPRNTKFFIDTAITQVYQIYENYDFALHFNTWKEILSNRNIVLVSGEGILDKLRFNILKDSGCVVENVYGPSMHAFSKLAETINKVLVYPPEKYIVCIILGPTAEPMVMDLTQRGYIACDIGHLLKDYDAWMRKAERSSESISKFFNPD